jgi:hypothetical protein
MDDAKVIRALAARGISKPKCGKPRRVEARLSFPGPAPLLKEPGLVDQVVLVLVDCCMSSFVAAPAARFDVADGSTR